MGKARILMQKREIKSISWSAAAAEQDLGELIPIAGSAMFIPFVLIKYIITFRKPKAIIFRYLNDYPSALKSFIRMCTDLVAISIAFFAKVKVVWICHNVDRESQENYRLLTAIRRSALKKVSKKVVLMDELLIEPALTMLKLPRSTFVAACFGKTSPDVVYNEYPVNIKTPAVRKITTELESWYRRQAKESGMLTGLWIGTPEKKIISGLKYMAMLHDHAAQQICSLRFIVVGPIGKWLQQVDPNTMHILKNAPGICFIDQNIVIPYTQWPALCDFVWKPCSDWSVNITVYNAAAAYLPIAGFKGSFMGQFIDHYGLGATIEPKSFELNDFMSQLKKWNNANAELFLQEKTWQKGAKAIFEASS